jgi:hypothetical protein
MDKLTVELEPDADADAELAEEPGSMPASDCLLMTVLQPRLGWARLWNP